MTFFFKLRGMLSYPILGVYLDETESESQKYTALCVEVKRDFQHPTPAEGCHLAILHVCVHSVVSLSFSILPSLPPYFASSLSVWALGSHGDELPAGRACSLSE